MNAFLKWMGFLNRLLLVTLTIVAAGVAVPANAAVDKLFSLSVQAFPDYTLLPATTPGSEVKAPVRVVATFTNLSPPTTASSNISSLTLSMAVPGMSIVNDPMPTGTSGNVVRTSPTSITVTNMTPLKGGGQQYTLTLYVSSCGDTTWTGTANTGSQLNGQPFKLKTAAGDPSLETLVSCGTPDCANPQGPQAFSVVDTTILSTAYLTGVQGAFNKDGACTPVNYFVSNMLSLNGQLHFRWPVTGAGAQPTAAFQYEITLPASLTTSASRTPRVGWLNLDGSQATSSNGTDTPVYVDPLLCLSAQLPAPIATLDTSISKTASQMKVTPVGTVPTVPFDVVMGTERMTVTSTQGGGPWRITRGVGGTNAAGHSAGAFVMSTPLPIFLTTPVSTLANGSVVAPASSPYQVGDQAQVCKTGDTVHNTTDDTYTTPLIDIGDAYVRGSF
jgi:hypothetical protein